MTLADYISVLRRRWSVVLRTLALTLALVLAFAFVVPRNYTASALLRLETISSGSVDWLNYELEYTDRLMNTYVELARSSAVRDELAASLGGAVPDVSVDIIVETELLRVNAAAATAEQAAAAANALADLLVTQEAEAEGREQVSSSIERSLTILQSQIDELEAGEGPLPGELGQLQLLRGRYDALAQRLEASQVSAALREPPTLRVVAPASAAASRAGLNPILLLLPLGLFLGLAGGVGLAFAFENSDPTLYSRARLRALTELPVLAQVTKQGSGAARSAQSAQRAEFDALVSALELLKCGEASCKLFVLSSASAGAGTSFIAAQLARSAAQSGAKTLLIDAHTQTPSLHQTFGLANDAGFSEFVAKDAAALSPKLLQSVKTPRLDVMTSGGAALPTFAAQHLTRLNQLRSHYDLIIVDAPPVLKSAQTADLSQQADVLILIAAQGRTERADFRAALERLELAGTPPRGVILNFAS